ncbi:MAG: DNA polymerase III subunit delta' [Pseudomonadota bacterium]
MSDDFPEADRAGDAPHPRETAQLFGQSAAEQAFIDAATGGRLHHAWLLTGSKGIGKATLAWRAARFLLTHAPADTGLFGEPEAPTSLDVSADHPVSRRIAALSEPGVLLIRRVWDADRKRFKSQITVDEVRKLGSYFGLSATDGGRRVVVVDSVDDMNSSAANALLKVLEEPPKDAVLFLVSHAPARLLPTIRSRCRELRLAPLSADALSQALTQAGVADVPPSISALSGGSVGEAMRLIAEGGADIYADIVRLLATCPALDRAAARALAEKAAARGAEARLDIVERLITLALSRLARHGTGAPLGAEAAPDEAQVFARLSPTPNAARSWADAAQHVQQRIGHGRAVNVDPASLLMDAFLHLNETAPRS